jgi:hypothetical protein
MVMYVAKKIKVQHIWNYFESRNGKGEHDGAGSCIKIYLRRKEMKFTTTSIIPYEKSIVEWCSSVMGEGTTTHEDQSPRKVQVHRYFW